MLVKDKKLTGRQKRLLHFKQMHAKSGLNLVSLMDIFTILVFFLLVNSGAQQLPSTKDVKLPTSVSSKTPQDNLRIIITKSDIVVAGHRIVELADVMNEKSTVIPALIAELKFQASNNLLHKEKDNSPHAITIMGDKDIPYRLLSKVLATCRAANYTHIDFAAYQQKKGKA